MIRQLALAGLWLSLGVGCWWMVKAGVESMVESWAPDSGFEGNSHSSGLRTRMSGRAAVFPSPSCRPAGTLRRVE